VLHHADRFLAKHGYLQGEPAIKEGMHLDLMKIEIIPNPEQKKGVEEKKAKVVKPPPFVPWTLEEKEAKKQQEDWAANVEYCNKLSEREGLKPYYELTVTKRGGEDGKQIDAADVKILGGSGYHIPTGVEWEHACRAGTKTKYFCGDKDEDLLDYAWCRENTVGRPHVVGEKKPNAFGLYDMHGNVREWNEEMLTNATTGAPERVSRGGNWSNPAGTSAVSHRVRQGPAARTMQQRGLRLARVPSPS